MVVNIIETKVQFIDEIFMNIVAIWPKIFVHTKSKIILFEKTLFFFLIKNY